jgi:hypothetical protein
MRQTATAEVRLDEGKATSSSTARRATRRFGFEQRHLRSNFVAVRLDETENHAQQSGIWGMSAYISLTDFLRANGCDVSPWLIRAQLASPIRAQCLSSATVTQRKGAGAEALTRDRTSQHRTRPDELLACGKAADCSAAPWFGYLARRCRIGQGGKHKRPV